MTQKTIFSLLVLIIVEQIIAQDSKSFTINRIDNSKFACANTTCLPFTTIISNLFQCQISCLDHSQCKAIQFHKSTFNCQLFTDIIYSINNMLIDNDVITMIVISDARITPG